MRWLGVIIRCAKKTFGGGRRSDLTKRDNWATGRGWRSDYMKRNIDGRLAVGPSEEVERLKGRQGGSAIIQMNGWEFTISLMTAVDDCA